MVIITSRGAKKCMSNAVDNRRIGLETERNIKEAAGTGSGLHSLVVGNLGRSRPASRRS